MVSEKKISNRLANEKSPYLLQHVYNPVDWHPWGEEAFAKAREEDKPVFLSVGYSTCHWCHVMAHESFEDARTARALNEAFICVKVDREERPDVDHVYMSVCQALTGSGGWPLTVLMTPDQKPFWAGTYLPRTSRHGRMGLMELTEAIRSAWRDDREKLVSAGDRIAAFLHGQSEGQTEGAQPDQKLVEEGAQIFARSFDKRFGGFGPAPKFPSPHNLVFLLRYAALSGDDSARAMAEHTLLAMYRGGIFDHVGGGFSRYSTDEKWLAPHFEKMLYDNALLTYAYAEAYQMTGREIYRRAAGRTIGYVLRELTHAEGGFYCGQDADSEGEEGKYYVFTPGELTQVLGQEDSRAFCDWFGITQAGNFEGKSIPNLLSNSHFEERNPRMEALSEKVYAYRAARTPLGKDDKVLTSWNALMIAALAKSARAFGADAYRAAAARALAFIEKNLMDGERLRVRFRDGEAAHDGHLDDYAFLAFALIEMYETTFDVSYLERAARLAARMTGLFAGGEAGGFFLTASDGERLIARPKEVYDGALPSGNSVAGYVLHRLFKLTAQEMWRDAAEGQLAFLSGAAKDYPAGHAMALVAVMGEVYPSEELVCVTSGPGAPAELAGFLKKTVLPNRTVLVKTPENAEVLAGLAPFTREYPIPDGGSAYYLCKEGTCRPPVADPNSF